MIQEQIAAQRVNLGDTGAGTAVNESKKLPTFEPKTLDELTKMYLASLNTAENLQNAYGGPVRGQEAEVDAQGKVNFQFNRPVVFPAQLILDF